jgi:hypothetical protein
VSRTSFPKLYSQTRVNLRQLTFSLDDLLVLGVICTEEGNRLAGIECLLQFIVNLPSVVTLLHQNEGCRVGGGGVGLCAGCCRIEEEISLGAA